MRKLQTGLIALAVGILISACGKGGSVSGPSGNGDQNGKRIVSVLGGLNLYDRDKIIARLYVEGSCDGSDNRGQNVTSLDAGGNILIQRGTCQTNTRFDFVMRDLGPYGANGQAVELYTEIGPADKQLKVTLPLDPVDQSFFIEWQHSNSRTYIGCQWRVVHGNSGRFDDIDQPCNIRGAGPVGAARTGGRMIWGQMSGPGGTIRREYLDGECAEGRFYRHPDTHNIEYEFSVNDGGSRIQPNQTVTCREIIRFF